MILKPTEESVIAAHVVFLLPVSRWSWLIVIATLAENGIRRRLMPGASGRQTMSRCQDRRFTRTRMMKAIVFPAANAGVHW